MHLREHLICKQGLRNTAHPDDMVGILITEYLTACKGHVVLDAIETSFNTPL